MTSHQPTEDVDLKVGELARRTGLSVRALHHYDAIGLLRPSRRTAAGHRVYGGGDVARLLRIRALQQLGFSLDEIRGMLDDAERYPPARVLELRLQGLREQIAAAQQLRARLEGLLGRLDEDVSVGEFLDATLEMTMFEKHFTPEQLAEMQRRHDQMDPEQMRAVETEWPQLVESLRAARQAGTAADDPEVQRLAARLEELLTMFTGGDPALRASMDAMYASEPQVRDDHGLDHELMGYVAAARGAAGH